MVYVRLRSFVSNWAIITALLCYIQPIFSINCNTDIGPTSISYDINSGSFHVYVGQEVLVLTNDETSGPVVTEQAKSHPSRTAPDTVIDHGGGRKEYFAGDLQWLEVNGIKTSQSRATDLLGNAMSNSQSLTRVRTGARYIVMNNGIEVAHTLLILEVKVQQNGQELTVFIQNVFSLDARTGNYVPEKAQQIYSNESTTPSALAYIDTIESKHKFIVFFGLVWSEVLVDSDNDLFILNQKNQVRSSGPWLECPQELCLEATFDAAYRSETATLTFLFRGRWSYAFNQLNNQSALVSTSDMTTIPFKGYLDATFTHEGETFSIKSDQFIAATGNLESDAAQLVELFTEQLPGERIDAVFTCNTSSIHVISGPSLRVYKYISKDVPAKLTDGPVLVSSRWPGIPQHIDSAVEHSVADVIFFKNNFNYQASTAGGQLTARLTPGNLFKCEDSFYDKQLATLIGISTYKQFASYYEQFKESAYTPDGKRSTTQSDEQKSAVAESNKSLSGLSIGLIIGFVLILAAGMILVIVMRNRKAKLRPMEYFDNTTVYTTVQSIDSQSVAM